MEAKYLYYEDYLEITVTGEFTKDMPENISPEFIMKECEKHSISKIFMNGINVTGNINTIDRFNIGKIYAQVFRGSNIKFSMVASKDIINPDSFFETVAGNRGVNVKVFTDLDEAKKWLLN